MTVLLTRKAELQVAVENTYNINPGVGVNDSVLVDNPMFTAKPNVLERNFVRNDLSPINIIIGRLLASMTFETELRGNGKQNSGIGTDAPIIARLFRACGYALVASAAPVFSGPFIVGDTPTAVTWTKSAGSATNLDVVAYYIAVTTGGASATAMVTITSDTPGDGGSAEALTSGSPLTLGTFGGTVTPTWTGTLVVGQKWVVWLMPPGLALNPVSDSFESVSLILHKDGVKHEMPGSFGTFEITAEAGKFATVKWTFTGTYRSAVDDANPAGVFETTLPSQVELARLHIGAFQAIVDKFTFNQQNDIQIRPDVSSPEGYIGTRIVSRKPQGAIDPEADLVANNDFWTQMATALRMPFQMRVGHVPGNTVWVIAPNTQYTGLTYADRNGILVYDAGLHFSRSLGNDEVQFYLC
jgi:hypothetical protein